jgi:hypothetical protein
VTGIVVVGTNVGKYGVVTGIYVGGKTVGVGVGVNSKNVTGGGVKLLGGVIGAHVGTVVVGMLIVGTTGGAIVGATHGTG